MDSLVRNGLAILLEDDPRPLIIIASSDMNLRQRWRATLQAGPYAVKEVAGRSALERGLPRLKPFLLFFDLSLSTRGGTAGISRIRLLSPQTKVIALTPEASDAEGIAVLGAGAQGYCQHDINDTLLQRAVEVVEQGEIWTSRRLVSSLLQEFQAISHRLETMSVGKQQPPFTTLTLREYEVGFLISRGASNREIAQELQVSERTVKSHVTALFRKFGVSDRVRLALLMTGQSITVNS